MKAKADYSSVVIAFGGFEFVNNEWRDVPSGFEDQAVNHPLLQIEQTIPEPEPEPVEPVEPKPTPRKRAPRKRTTTQSKGTNK